MDLNSDHRTVCAEINFQPSAKNQSKDRKQINRRKAWLPKLNDSKEASDYHSSLDHHFDIFQPKSTQDVEVAV
eukprot:4381687-Karenia_brevis.AAC.1